MASGSGAWAPAEWPGAEHGSQMWGWEGHPLLCLIPASLSRPRGQGWSLLMRPDRTGG